MDYYTLIKLYTHVSTTPHPPPPNASYIPDVIFVGFPGPPTFITLTTQYPNSQDWLFVYVLLLCKPFQANTSAASFTRKKKNRGNFCFITPYYNTSTVKKKWESSAFFHKVPF